MPSVTSAVKWISETRVTPWQPGMMAAKRGSIVSISSVAGKTYCDIVGVHYAATKAAIIGLTKHLAGELGPYGITVNAIAPGEIETAILSPGTEKIVEGLPMRRLGQPREVADAIWFLCSDQSSYISGAEIEVNGAQHV